MIRSAQRLTLPLSLLMMTGASTALATPVLFSQSGAGAETREAAGFVTPSSQVGTLFSTQQTTRGPNGIDVTADLSASSQSRIGSLSASSFARLQSNGDRGAVFSTNSSAFWKDRITIDAPTGSGLQGQAGVFTGIVSLDGLLSTTGSNVQASIGIGFVGDLRNSVRIVGAPDNRWREFAGSFASGSEPSAGWASRTLPDPFFGDLVNPISFTDTGPSQTAIVFSMPIVFGQAFDFGVGLLTSTRITGSTGNGLDQIASSNFASTVNWRGIQGIRAGSTEVLGYAVSSASGFDFTRAYAAPNPDPDPNPDPNPNPNPDPNPSPVPVPGSIALLLAGLVGLVSAALRRRQSAAATSVRV